MNRRFSNIINLLVLVGMFVLLIPQSGFSQGTIQEMVLFQKTYAAGREAGPKGKDKDVFLVPPHIENMRIVLSAPSDGSFSGATVIVGGSAYNFSAAGEVEESLGGSRLSKIKSGSHSGPPPSPDLRKVKLEVRGKEGVSVQLVVIGTYDFRNMPGYR